MSEETKPSTAATADLTPPPTALGERPEADRDGAGEAWTVLPHGGPSGAAHAGAGRPRAAAPRTARPAEADRSSGTARAWPGRAARPGDGDRALPTPRMPEKPALLDLMWTVFERRWTVAIVAAEVVLLGLLYLALATPSYRADAVVQVEERVKGLAGLSELSAMLGEQTAAETEIAIIRSRMSLGRVVDELGLDRTAEPQYLPVLGRSLARRWDGDGPAPARFGMPGYGWGGERIQLAKLTVPADLLEKPLTLTALDGGRYLVEAPEGGLRLEGKVGEPASTGQGKRALELQVSELTARPGTRFRVIGHRRADVVAYYQKELRIFEDGKKSGILVLSLDGPDPERTAVILNAVANAYVRQGVERNAEEASKALDFLETQLPQLKQSLTTAEGKLNAFQVKKGSVDVSKETQGIIDRAVVVDKILSELELSRSELLQRFTPHHPQVVAVDEKLWKLRQEKAGLATRMKGIPEVEIDSARLARDVKVNNELYMVLLNKAQELRVAKSGTVGNVRLLDEAVPPRKANSPKVPLVLLLSTVLGLASGAAAAVVRKAFEQGLADAEEVEEGTGLPVYATLPHSDRHAGLVEVPSKPGGTERLLAAVDPQDPAVESLRSLRTSLQFAFLEARNNVIAISGPTAGAGKSFVCANLAYLLTSETQRVLLIDGDLRKGRLHRYFGLERRPGLCDVLSGTAQFDAAIRTTDQRQLDVLPTGSIPPNPTELLGSQRFDQLVRWASSRYAYVVIDTPPALPVADPTLVARLAGVNLLVLRASQHSLREVTLTLKRFAQAGAKVHGAVLNDAVVLAGRYGRNGRYAKYEYRSESEGG